MSSELLLSRPGGRVWAAFREDGSTVEIQVDADPGLPAVGRIYKGRVTRVLSGLQAAFVDIGATGAGFLPATALRLPGEGERAAGVPIEQRLKVGRELLVQVVREPRGEKGARLSAELTLPGRFLVLSPARSSNGVSRWIRDPSERDRLLGILAGLTEECGFIARTASHGATEAQIAEDAEELRRAWAELQKRGATARAPAVVRRESDLVSRTLERAAGRGIERIVTDTPELKQEVLDRLTGIDPDLAVRVELHSGPEPLFEQYGVARAVTRALRPRVWLRCGGYLVIQETEALVSIDVNTGKFQGRSGMQETALKVDLEAATAVAAELRLRNLGGIVVIDFVDLAAEEDRRKVLETLQGALIADPARTRVLGFTELGLVQLTRHRTRPSLAALLTERCPRCSGQGQLRTPGFRPAPVNGAQDDSDVSGE